MHNLPVNFDREGRLKLRLGVSDIPVDSMASLRRTTFAPAGGGCQSACSTTGDGRHPVVVASANGGGSALSIDPPSGANTKWLNDHHDEATISGATASGDMEEAWIDFALKAGLHFAAVGFFIGFGFWSGAWLVDLARKNANPQLFANVGIALLLGVVCGFWVGGIVALFGYPILFIVPWPVPIRNVLLSLLVPFLEEFNYLLFISWLALMLCALIAGWDIVREHKHSKVVEGFQRLGIVLGTVLGLALIAFGILTDGPWWIVTRIGVAVFLTVYGFFRLLGWIVDGFVSGVR